jgi:hypothetical protein
MRKGVKYRKEQEIENCDPMRLYRRSNTMYRRQNQRRNTRGYLLQRRGDMEQNDRVQTRELTTFKEGSYCTPRIACAYVCTERLIGQRCHLMGLPNRAGMQSNIGPRNANMKPHGPVAVETAPCHHHHWRGNRRKHPTDQLFNWQME